MGLVDLIPELVRIRLDNTFFSLGDLLGYLTKTLVEFCYQLLCQRIEFLAGCACRVLLPDRKSVV